MAKIMTYAQMADAVYADDPQVDGWGRIGFKRSGTGLTDAFQGAAFRKGNEVAFAFKGTSNARDLVADAKLAIGMNTAQYSGAETFVKSVLIPRGCQVVVTGHSLGGAIAQVVGNRQRLAFVTFNAPGVGVMSRNVGEMAASAQLGTMALRGAGTVLSAFRHPMQAARDLASIFYWVKGVNFRLGKDVVGCTGVHYGKVIEIPYSGGALDLLAKHKMTTMLEELAGSPFQGMELSALVD